MRRTSFQGLATLPGTAGPQRYIYLSKGAVRVIGLIGLRIERSSTSSMLHTKRSLGGPHGILDEIDPDQRWEALGCAVQMVAERTVHGCTTRAVRYYITNLPVDIGAARMANLVHGH